MTAKFSDKLHTESASLWQASEKHPFIQELASGKLPIDIFRYYLTQDTQYLKAFNELHAEVAKILPKEQGDLLLHLASSAGEATERNQILDGLDMTFDDIFKVEMAPTNYAYITHMEHQLNVSPEAAVAGLLPCYWLYAEIALKWRGQTSPVPVYQKFFDGYAADNFTGSTDELIKIVDNLADNADDKTRKQMETAFMRSSHYELAFWQMAYTHQTWDDLGK